jgi:hypothetical protein
MHWNCDWCKMKHVQTCLYYDQVVWLPLSCVIKSSRNPITTPHTWNPFKLWWYLELTSLLAGNTWSCMVLTVEPVVVLFCFGINIIFSSMLSAPYNMWGDLPLLIPAGHFSQWWVEQSSAFLRLWYWDSLVSWGKQWMWHDSAYTLL